MAMAMNIIPIKILDPMVEKLPIYNMHERHIEYCKRSLRRIVREEGAIAYGIKRRTKAHK